MASYQDQMTLTRTAAADLSGKQYHFVNIGLLGTTNMASLSTASTLGGVLLTNPQSGERATIAYSGIGKVTVGAAVAEAAFVTTNGSGRAVTAGSGDMVAGRVLEAAGNDGEIVTTLLFPPFRWSGAA